MEFWRKKNCIRFFARADAVDTILDEEWILDVLQRSEWIAKDDVLCMQSIRYGKTYDVTVKTEDKCVKFFEWWRKENVDNVGVSVSFMGKPRRLVVNMEDPFVGMDEILDFLKEKCLFAVFEKNYKNKVGIWNGKRRFLVWFKEGELFTGKIIVNGNFGFCYVEGEKVRNSGTKVNADLVEVQQYADAIIPLDAGKCVKVKEKPIQKMTMEIRKEEEKIMQVKVQCVSGENEEEKTVLDFFRSERRVEVKSDRCMVEEEERKMECIQDKCIEEALQGLKEFLQVNKTVSYKSVKKKKK